MSETRCGRCEAKVAVALSTIERYEGLEVTLVDVPGYRCRVCGERVLRVPDEAGVNHLIARLLIEKRAQLVGAEVRFIRTLVLGMTGAQLAKLLGTTPETVSRWENDRVRISTAFDKLIRLLVAAQSGYDWYAFEELEYAACSEPSALSLEIPAVRKPMKELIEHVISLAVAWSAEMDAERAASTDHLSPPERLERYVNPGPAHARLREFLSSLTVKELQVLQSVMYIGRDIEQDEIEDGEIDAMSKQLGRETPRITAMTLLSKAPLADYLRSGLNKVGDQL